MKNFEVISLHIDSPRNNKVNNEVEQRVLIGSFLHEGPNRAGGKAMFKQIHAWIFVLLLAVIAILYPHPIQAQDRAGVLQGVVKDSSGAPVSGAFVKMKNAERRLTFMVISQVQGRYSVNSLPGGKYVVQGIGGEYQSEPSAPVDVTPGAPATVNLSLTVTCAPQLPGAWPGRLPGEQVGEGEGGASPPALPDGEGKQILEAKCVSCHDAHGSRESKPTATGGKPLSKTCELTLRAQPLRNR